jgi:putative ABC transport system permease protein
MEMGDSGGRHVSQIAFAPRRPDLAKEAITEIRQALGALYSFDPDDTSALDVKENLDYVAQVETVSLGLEALVLTIAALALVLGCLGAANVVGIAVSERTAELGLRKALGATSARVRAEVLTETLVLCVVGGALGVLVGVAAIALLGPLRFGPNASLEPHADATLLALSFAVLVVTATLAGLPAANRAARLDPIVALRED